METIIWIIVVVVAAFILYYLFANQASNPESPGQVSDQDISNIKRDIKREIKRDDSTTQLDQFYRPAREIVPQDYPRKLVGECPFSRAQKQELPASDVPMCMLQRT